MLQKRKIIDAGGGEKGITKQHTQGKLTARERILKLLDEGSFVELDAYVQHRCSNFGMEKKVAPADGVITGYGTVNGRLVYIFAQDFTVLGGSLGEMHADKIVKVQELALKTGAPLIGLNDSGGARVQEGVDALTGYGKVFYKNVMASGVIPQISVILGSCAGGAVYSPALTDFIMVVDQISKMFITGPEVVKSVTGEDVPQEVLGGALTHNTVTGVAHTFDVSEVECFQRIRNLLSYLPQNNMESAPVIPCDTDINSLDETLDTIIPESANKAYDMKNIVTSLADNGEFFEIMPLYAKNIVVGFMRLNGRSVGVVANQPMDKAGTLDINASDKGARFVRTCDAFNIPILTLQDVPGFMPGTEQEYGGIIRHGAKLLYAYCEATVPKVTVIVRKGYGGSYVAMGSKQMGVDFVYAWPTAMIAVMGASGAANIVFRNDIKNADDPAKMRMEKMKEYDDTIVNPYIAASRGEVDDVILPRETRRRLINAFNVLETKRIHNPSKKHGNMPL